ncbi:serine hydrolase domain-containing protein [Actinomadura macrotermitis]|uniref:D-alanyl-D-alanine carboxypeptidase n=1 Tax=Actinomadura macrotermitis TaxID=2585200 RepID=A0A7K0C507_9ACTN|nr:serine hydrolase domain-containing protein [Actinomadura macrotermitis]MQY08531.1 D-alanyl-D-alanine carboxypeptidase [Actinomadura macrotermitis]
MTFRRTTTALTVALAAGGVPAVLAGPASAAPRCGDRPAVRRAMERLTGTDRVPGVAVRIEDPRCGTWSAASGKADLRTGRPMRADERVRIGSVTKSFTATVVLQLAAEGRLSLDAPVDRYLPGLIRKGPYDGRRITVRSLLRHTSGLPDHMDSFDDSGQYRFRHFEPRELVARALAMDPPAKEWHYSTTNYIVAGMIVQAVTGHRTEDEAVRRIVRPLGLRDTYWPGDATGIRGRHPRGYVREEKDGTVRWTDRTRMNISAGGAGGAIISSPPDVARFFGALLGGRLLPPALLAEMRRTVLADPDRVWPGARYGLGLIETPLSCGGTWTGHAGGIEGYSAYGGVRTGGRRLAVSMNEDAPDMRTFQDVLALVDTAFCDDGRKNS